EKALVGAFNDYANNNLAAAWDNWRVLKREPRNPVELAMVAECLADQGKEAASGYIDQLQAIDQTEATAIRARLFWRQNRIDEAAATAGDAVKLFHVDPWPRQALISRTIDLAADLAKGETMATVSIYNSLREPFAVY